nr:hypothetical protein Iba_chr04cCG17570 [Ipomoea batatas]
MTISKGPWRWLDAKLRTLALRRKFSCKSISADIQIEQRGNAKNIGRSKVSKEGMQKIQGGIVPLKLLDANLRARTSKRSKVVKEGMEKTQEGIVPFSVFSDKSNAWRFWSPLATDGRGPICELPDKSKISSWVRFTIEDGKQP